MVGGAIFLSLFIGADWATAKTAWIFMLLPVVGCGTLFVMTKNHYNAKSIAQAQPGLVERIQSEGRLIEGTETPIYDDKNLFSVSYSTINPDAFMAQPDFPEGDVESLAATLAAILPVSMAIGFLLIMLWFKANGGYRPIVLGEDGVS